MFIVLSKTIGMRGLIKCGKNGVIDHPDIAVESKEESVGQMGGFPREERFAKALPELID